MAGPVVNSLSGLLLERGGKVVEGCGGCPTLLAALTFVSSGGSPFTLFDLTWDPVPVGGEYLWRYQGGDLPVCSGSTAPELELREVAFWCPAGSTNFAAELVTVEGGSQNSYATIGGTLNAFLVNNPSSPRTIYTRTNAGSLNFCTTGWLGHIRLDVRVAL